MNNWWIPKINCWFNSNNCSSNTNKTCWSRKGSSKPIERINLWAICTTRPYSLWATSWVCSWGSTWSCSLKSPIWDRRICRTLTSCFKNSSKSKSHSWNSKSTSNKICKAWMTEKYIKRCRRSLPYVSVIWPTTWEWMFLIKKKSIETRKRFRSQSLIPCLKSHCSIRRQSRACTKEINHQLLKKKRKKMMRMSKIMHRVQIRSRRPNFILIKNFWLRHSRNIVLWKPMLDPWCLILSRKAKSAKEMNAKSMDWFKPTFLTINQAIQETALKIEKYL